MVVASGELLVRLRLQESRSINDGSKRMLKLYVHPESVHQKKWCFRSETMGPKVLHDIKIPIAGSAVQIEDMDMLSTSSYSTISDMVSLNQIDSENHAWLVNEIIYQSREIIAKEDAEISNKSLVISVEIRVDTVSLLEEQELRKVEQFERLYSNGSSSSMLTALERGRLIDNLCCERCNDEFLAGFYQNYIAKRPKRSHFYGC